MPDYGFRPMTVADLPMIRHWLATPDVVQWWGDPDEQYALMRDDLDHPDMDQFIVSVVGHPFGYIQCYALSTWNQGFGEHPAGTRGIDQFIGEPDLVGRGHGSQFIRRFTDHLLQQGTPRVVTDPDPANLRAIRAYEKVGFSREQVVQTPDGPALLMLRDRSSLS
ncbi:MAG: GNAT family N-acetyltransferase [Bradyrhizobium sp.]|uniref:GNAT family N-acetyltransferase n=1 Tax=Bradyrhizobium sp. TaxID=376 RepID=UPI001D6D7B30|nr:GNAT family N-acetyltransferase [Bradyrhizobium sp.]MBV9561056.1 GNAT family N-acetyltransferase [Bradyrhizobium sp.]